MQPISLMVPLLCVTAIKLSRHTGMDCRYPVHKDVKGLRRPWLLGSGNPCRNDVFILNLVAVMLCEGTCSGML